MRRSIHKDHKDPLVPLELLVHKDHKDHKEQQLLFLAVFQTLMLCIPLVDPTILKDFLIIIFQQP